MPAEISTPDVLELADLEAEQEGAATLTMAKAKAEPLSRLDAVPEAAHESAQSAPDVPPTPNAATLMREKQYQTRRKGRARIVLALWLIAALILIGGLIAAVIQRQAIVERAPGAAALFQAVGLPTTVTGLEIVPVEMRQVNIDGTDYLLVSGAVRNLTRESRYVPPVAFTMLSASGDELASWTIDVSETDLAGAERRDFTSEYPNPPLEATTLRYQFEMPR